MPVAILETERTCACVYIVGKHVKCRRLGISRCAQVCIRVCAYACLFLCSQSGMSHRRSSEEPVCAGVTHEN